MKQVEPITHESRSEVEFINYPFGKTKIANFMLMKDAKYLSVLCDEKGIVKRIVVRYRGKRGGITMSIVHDWSLDL